MTLAIRVLLGLIAGFLLGLAVAGSSSTGATLTLAIVGPIGTIFVNLIRLTVVPLVFFMVISTILLAGFAAWAIIDWKSTQAWAMLAMGLGSGASALVIPFYARSFLRKTREVSWL